jgi:hypothetical protein
MRIEPDLSGASVFLAAVVTGGRVIVPWPQETTGG